MAGPKWTDAEDAVVRDLYPMGGWRAVQALYPDRTTAAIQARASRLGVRA
ncbi:SANT/Myb-like DNA-binding domain-containing protein [Luteimonas saliphila]|nr:SANT/Myb-like DNA-binding domain-containing protein [Luteimonas saliphila]